MSWEKQNLKVKLSFSLSGGIFFFLFDAFPLGRFLFIQTGVKNMLPLTSLTVPFQKSSALVSQTPQGFAFLHGHEKHAWNEQLGQLVGMGRTSQGNETLGLSVCMVNGVWWHCRSHRGHSASLAMAAGEGTLGKSGSHPISSWGSHGEEGERQHAAPWNVYCSIDDVSKSLGSTGETHWSSGPRQSHAMLCDPEKVCPLRTNSSPTSHQHRFQPNMVQVSGDISIHLPYGGPCAGLQLGAGGQWLRGTWRVEQRGCLKNQNLHYRPSCNSMGEKMEPFPFWFPLGIAGRLKHFFLTHAEKSQ